MADPPVRKPYDLAALTTLSFCIALALLTNSHDLISPLTCPRPLITEGSQPEPGSVAHAGSVLEEAARRDTYRLRLLAEKQAELNKFQESLKRENGGAYPARAGEQPVPAAVRSGIYT